LPAGRDWLIGELAVAGGGHRLSVRNHGRM